MHSQCRFGTAPGYGGLLLSRLTVGRSVVMGSSTSLGRAPAPPHVTTNTSCFHYVFVDWSQLGTSGAKDCRSLRHGSHQLFISYT
jgi:hypothetical protein